MLLLLALTALVLGAFLGYLLWTRNWVHWGKKGVKCVKPSFPYGNTKRVFDGKETLSDFCEELIRQYPQERLIGFYSFFSPMLVVNDLKLVKQVLSQDFSKYISAGFTLGSEDRILNGFSFWQTEHKQWKEYRSRFTPGLTANKQKAMVPIMREAAQRYMDKYKSTNGNKQLTVTEIINYTLHDSILRIVLGIEVDLVKAAENKNHDLGKLLQGDVFTNGKDLHLTFSASFLAPWLHKIQTMRIISKEMDEFYVKFFKSVVKQRKSSPNSRDDTLNAIINVEKKIMDQGGPGFTDVEWASNLLTMMIDSTETTSLVLHMSLLLIAQHPEEQEKMRQEIRQVGTSLKDFDYDKIHSLKRMEMVIFECLRLHNPVLILARVAGETTELGGVIVDKGTRLFLPVTHIHRDPQYFPDPLTFNPDRFADGDIHKSGAFLSFADGPRACLGQRYALLIMKVLLIGMLLEHNIVLGDEKLKYTKVDPMSPFIRKFEDELVFKLVPIASQP